MRVAAPILLAIAVAAFIALNLTIGLHSDDLQIIGDAHGSYADAWTSPFLDRFYRPIVVTIVRASQDLFGTVAIPLRILQGVLIAASVYTLVTLRRELDATARYAAGAVLLASPLTFVAVSPFAVGIGDLIVGLAFLISVRACLTKIESRTAAALVGLAVIAMFSKESGLLVAAYTAYETGRRRHFVACAAICGAAASYLVFRTTFVVRESFEFSTGYFFDTYSAAELTERFGAAPARLYVYNLLANLFDVLIGFPERGALRLPAHALLLIPAIAASSALVVRYLTVQRRWRAQSPLVVVIVMNAMLGYTYVRPRIMFVAAFATTILLLHALDDLLRRPQRVLGLGGRTIAAIVVCLWLCVLVHSLIRLPLQAAAST